MDHRGEAVDRIARALSEVANGWSLYEAQAHLEHALVSIKYAMDLESRGMGTRELIPVDVHVPGRIA